MLNLIANLFTCTHRNQSFPQTDRRTHGGDVLKPLIQMLFSCQHDKLTWPQSPRRIGPLTRFRRQEKPKVSCLGCGAEFEYDLKHMKVGKRIYPATHQHPDVRPTLDQTEGA